MADVITRLKVESSEYDSKIKRATQSLNEMTTAAERQGNKIATANKQNIALAQSLGKMQTVSTTARGKMSELSSAIEAATIQYNRLTAAEKQGQFGRALDASITKLRGRLAGLKNEMAAVQGQMGKTSMMGGMGGFGAGGGGGLSKIGGGFSKGIGGAAAMLGPAAAGAAAFTAAMSGVKKVVSDVISINKTFEQSTANLTAVMGRSKDELKDLINQAKQLGATTQYTASQILELQTNLGRLGFDPQEILNSTSAVQALATATGADLGEAANLAGAALRGFGLDSSEMERVASVLSVSTTKSALSFEKLATAMPIVAPVAKQFGFSIEDTVALLGKLSDAGMDASSAATATRNIFLKMADGSGKLSQAMGRPVHNVEEFGVALKDMKEKGMDLNDMLNMVGVRSAAAFAVFADNADTLSKLKTEITDCSDAMYEMQDKQLNTLQGSVTKLSSAWEGLMLTFSESGGVLKDVVDWLTNAVQAFTKWRNIYRVGGDQAILQYEKGVTNETKKAADTLVKAYQDGGTSNEDIAAQYAGEKVELEKKKEALVKQLKLIEEENSTLTKVNKYLTPVNAYASMAVSTVETKVSGKEDLYKEIAAVNDQIATVDYILAKVTDKPSSDTKTKTGSDEDGSGAVDEKMASKLKAQYEEQEKAQIAALDRMKLGEEQYESEVYKIKKTWLEKTLQLYQEDSTEYARTKAKISDLEIKHQATQTKFANKEQKPQETAEKKVEKALEDYATSINLATIRKEAGLDDEEKYKEKELAAHERLFQAYAEAYNTYADPKYKENLDKEAAEVLKLSKAVSDLKDIAEKKKQEAQLDNKILGGLTGAAKKAGWTTADLGTTGIKTQIDAGVDISEDTWKEFEKKLNERLKELKMDPIQINFETGSIENPLDAANKDMDKLKTNVEGAIGVFGQLGGAMEQLEDPGAKVAGIIMQAIASVAGSFAKSLMGAVSPWDWIAAAIGGVSTMISTIAAIKSATSGGYANGGVIPGNSFSGDNMRGMLPSGEMVGLDAGELILNRAQQASIAGQLQGNNPMSNLRLSTEISGYNLRVVLNNDNRARGGSRNFYSELH